MGTGEVWITLLATLFRTNWPSPVRASVGGHGDQVKPAILSVVHDLLNVIAVPDHGIHFHPYALQVSLHFRHVFLRFPDDIYLMLSEVHPRKGMGQRHPQKGDFSLMDLGPLFNAGQNSFGQFGAIQGAQNFFEH